jgi:hypothetical protein
MSPTVVNLDQLDTDISMAYLALRGARTSRDRSPNAENEGLVADAERSVNRLLDARFAAQN